MISTKSPRELELMKEAGRIVALAHKAIKEAIGVGVSTKELDDIAYKVITEADAKPSFKGYNGFPASICASINDVLVHGIPDNTVLKDGDIISVDIGACYKGYHGDSAWTYAVGTVDEETLRLMEVTKQSLFEGLKQAKPGNHIGDISCAIGTYVHKHGYSVPLEYTGHGVGAKLHEDPSIPNDGVAGRGARLKTGMTLAIEPMVHVGKPHTQVMSDGWTVKTKDGSLCAHYEHSIVVTDTGYEILTQIPEMEVSNG